MATGYRIRVDSEDFRKAINSSKSKIKKEFKKSMKEIGSIVAGNSVKRCPRPGDPLDTYKADYQVTGYLARSIRFKVRDFKKVTILAGHKGDYAKYVHGGTVHMPPRPFLKKGLIDSDRDIHVIIRKTVANILSSIE